MLTPQYNNTLLPSFQLFVDHELCKNNGYTNYSGQLYPTLDPNFSNYNILGSPFRQWVMDSSVSGANIPSGIFIDNNFVARNTSGLNIDFLRGRIISNIPSGLNTFTASYAVKDFNIYTTQVSEEYLLFELAPNLPEQSAIGSNPNHALFYLDQPYASIYIREEYSQNDPLAFGGLDETKSTIKAIILSDQDWKLDAAMSILRDSARRYFPNLLSNQLPYNIFGDLKNYSSLNWSQISILWSQWTSQWNGFPIYNYNFTVDAVNQTQLVFIDKVKVKRFPTRIERKIGDSIVAGLVEFDLISVRYPRNFA